MPGDRIQIPFSVDVNMASQTQNLMGQTLRTGRHTQTGNIAQRHSIQYVKTEQPQYSVRKDRTATVFNT